MAYLLDSGVLIRLVNRGDSLHAVVRAAVRALRARGVPLFAASQNVAEFWSVWTRPPSARGGLGRPVADAARHVRLLERTVHVATETLTSYRLWKELVGRHTIIGVQVHDARLVAIMQTRGIVHLLTLNPADFRRYPGLFVVTPQDLIAQTPAP